MKYVSVVLAIITMLSTYPFIFLLWQEGVSMPLWLRLLFGAIVLMSLFVGIMGLVDSSRKSMIVSVLLVLLNVAILFYIAHGIAQSINKKAVNHQVKEENIAHNDVLVIKTDTFEFGYNKASQASWETISIKVDENYWPSHPVNTNRE